MKSLIFLEQLGLFSLSLYIAKTETTYFRHQKGCVKFQTFIIISTYFLRDSNSLLLLFWRSKMTTESNKSCSKRRKEHAEFSHAVIMSKRALLITEILFKI